MQTRENFLIDYGVYNVRFKSRAMINTCLSAVVVMGLAACQHQNNAPVVVKQQVSPFETGQAMINDPVKVPPQSTLGMVNIHDIVSRRDVQVFPLEGDIPDPFRASRKRVSVLDNTTSGGYTVLTPGVQVFPLDDTHEPMILGGRQAPSLNEDLPVKEVSPLSFGPASDDLPPIEPSPKLTMPAPSALKPPIASPFKAGTTSLTGYEGEAIPPMVSEQGHQRHNNNVEQPSYTSLAQRSGRRSVDNATLTQQEPVALHQKWGTAKAVSPSVSMPSPVSAPTPVISNVAPPMASATSSEIPTSIAPQMQQRPAPAMIGQANPSFVDDLPPEQPRRTPDPMMRGGMLTGY